ncbi:MAG: dihydroorotate dehydrogenase electron transfer subunit [Candidatus Diapherotrites archaeon]
MSASCTGERHVADVPEMAAVTRVTDENKNVRIIYIDKKIECAPGQFVMLWLPGLDEKPYSVFLSGRENAILVRRKGKFTNALFGLREGDKVGLRGPYGKGFETKGVKKPLLVAGGCGVASLMMLAQHFSARGKNKKPDFIFGVKTKNEIFCEGLLGKHTNLYITSDDGSAGERGFPTALAEKMLRAGKGGAYDMAYSCGPEKMMKGLQDVCERAGVNYEFSLERYFRCGFGVCGACEIDGMLVCKDGPVFTREQLKKMPSFGKASREKSGKEISLH